MGPIRFCRCPALSSIPFASLGRKTDKSGNPARPRNLFKAYSAPTDPGDLCVSGGNILAAHVEVFCGVHDIRGSILRGSICPVWVEPVHHSSALEFSFYR